MKKKNEIMTVATAEELAVLDNSYPVEQGFNRIFLPRLEFVSQDQTEGKGKAMKVTVEAGTFFTSVQTDEEDEDGKKVWEKKEIGKEVELIILFERKQLKFYDGEKYISSPIYDTDDQIVPLFRDKKEYAKGTPVELKKMKEFQGLTAKGKPTSKLEENKVLYVLYDGEMYQMTIRGTSMYAFRDYKKNIQPNKVVTILDSEAKENGATEWNQITWAVKRPLTKEELDIVVAKLHEIREGVELEKSYYASQNETSEKADKELEDF